MAKIDVRSIVEEIQKREHCRVIVSFHADKQGCTVWYNDGTRTDYRGEVIWVGPGPREGDLGYYQEQFDPPPAPRMPYTVEFGPSCSQKVEFAEFGYALAFYRGFRLVQKAYVKVLGDLSGFDDGPRIVNYDRAELGNSGLTEDEREALSNAE